MIIAKNWGQALFLRRGLRIAFFRLSLTVPLSIDLFIIWVVMGAKTAACSLTNDDGIRSNSHVLACHFLINCVTALMVVNSNSLILCFVV